MDFLFKKIAYLRGLCEGSGFTPDSKEGKVFHGILDVLDEMGQIIEKIEESSGTYQSMEEDDFEDAEYQYSFICPNCGEEIEVEEDIFGKLEEFNCPKCGNVIPICTELEDLKF